MNYKIPVVPSCYNSFDKSKLVELKPSKLKAFNRYNEKYTKRKIWVENVEGKGMRFVHASYDSHKDKWMKPVKDKLYPFVALVRQYDATVKIYVNKTMHYTDILKLMEKWEFDRTQTDKLLTIIEQRRELYG